MSIIESRDWSGLSVDILCSILQKLPLVDTIRLKAVCSQWRSAVEEKGWRPAPQTPWLMAIGPVAVGDPPRTNSFFPLPVDSNRAYRIPSAVHDLYERLFVGSSNGWLVTINQTGDMHLLQPITGNQIELPHITTMKGINLVDCNGVAHIHRRTMGFLTTFPLGQLFNFYFHKAIVAPSSSSSSSSSSVDSYTVVGITFMDCKLVVTRTGDDNWTVVTRTGYDNWTVAETATFMTFHDIIYHKGVFYAITANGKTMVWDLTGPTHRIIEMLPDPGLIYGDFQVLYKHYLVEASGDLLMVRIEAYTKADRKSKVEIFKLHGGTGGKWEQLKSLRKRSLFLGLNESMSFSTLDFPELVENRIYFTEDGRCKHLDPYPGLMNGTGIYNLDDATFEPYSCVSKLEWPFPMWIMADQA